MMMAGTVCSVYAASGDSMVETVFADVARENWACSFVERAFRNGAVEGTTKDPVTGKPFYRPDSPMTMAQFATILTRVYYPDEYAANMDPVWDIPAKRVCENSGLIPQEKIDELWSKPVTRYEMAALAAKIARTKNVFTNAAADKNAEIKLASQSIPAEYYEDVFLVYSLGIIEGTDSKGTFNGSRTMSRAQGATVYCRMAEKVPFYSSVQRVPANGTGLSVSLDKGFAASFQLRYGVEAAGGAWEGYNCRFAATGDGSAEDSVKLPEEVFTVNTGKDIYLYTALYLNDYNSRVASLKGSDIVPQSTGYAELALKAFTSENSSDWTLKDTEYIGMVVDDPAAFKTAAPSSVKLEEFRSLEQVSDVLEKAGCIESQDAFIHALYRAGKADIKHIRTGTHSIPAGASVDDVVRLITK